MLEQVKKIGVIGSGLMGSGIAQICATAGYPVVFCDISLEIVERGMKAIKKVLDKDVSKGKLTAEQAQDNYARITPTQSYEDMSDVDVIFEAIIESIEIKKTLYRTLDALCKPSCVFATNTSGLSITEIAAATERSDKVVGAHFFNPVPVMKLLELIRGYNTSDESFALIRALGEKIGKEVIAVNEAPLFCVNRILVPMLNEAMFVLYEGIATKEDIDKGMVLGTNQPIGPLALADMVGLDTLLMVAETLYRETRDSKYRPCPLLVNMVRAKHYGRKSGQGFYKY